jgi:hypothetical protein
MKFKTTISDDLTCLASPCGVYLIRENYDSDDWDLFQWDRFRSSGPKQDMIDLAEELEKFN